MEKLMERNFLVMDKFYSMENTLIIRNGMEKDMIRMAIFYMN